MRFVPSAWGVVELPDASLGYLHQTSCCITNLAIP